MIEQNPNVSMADSFAGLSRKQITMRERLRMRALIGGVPVKRLSELTPAQLIDFLNDAHQNPDAYDSDPDIRPELTETLTAHRIPEIARHYPAHLHRDPASEVDIEASAIRPRTQPRSADDLTRTPPPPRRQLPRNRKQKPGPRPRLRRSEPDNE